MRMSSSGKDFGIMVVAGTLLLSLLFLNGCVWTNKDAKLGDLNVSGNLDINGNILSKGIAGIDYNAHVLKDADLIGLTKTYCDQNFKRGLLFESDC